MSLNPDTPTPIAELMPGALEGLRLGEDVRELAAKIGWRRTAEILGLSLNTTRMLGVDPSRCSRATRAFARARLAELTKGAA